MNTTAQNVIEYFESSFREKEVIPLALELKWLEKAVGWHEVECGEVGYDPVTMTFSKELSAFEQATIAQHMRVYYQEREVSKVNHRVSIVTSDLSIDGNGNGKTAAREELNHHRQVAEEMENMLFTTAFAD